MVPSVPWGGSSVEGSCARGAWLRQGAALRLLSVSGPPEGFVVGICCGSGVQRGGGTAGRGTGMAMALPVRRRRPVTGLRIQKNRFGFWRVMRAMREQSVMFGALTRRGIRVSERECGTIYKDDGWWKVFWYSGYLTGYFLHCNYTFRMEKRCFLQNHQKNLNVI